MSSENQKEKIKRIVEKSAQDEGMSPMSPPDYMNPPSKIDLVPYEQLPLPIKILIDEHKTASSFMDLMENTLIEFHNSQYNYSKEMSENFRKFFEFFDTKLLPHHQKEDKYLFPFLEKYLIKKGEHSKYMSFDNKYETSIDLMEDDHLKMMQVGSLIFNLLGIFVRIPDKTSRQIIGDIIYNKGIELIELIRLHIYQEENIIFPQACQYLTIDEFKQIEKHIH